MSLFRRRKEHYVSTDAEPEVEEHEEIEYVPVSVKDLLIEMKDISELIVDLAYSAIVYDSKDISEEVHDLEARMANLQYQTRIQTMMACRGAEDAEQLTGILQVANASHQIGEAAAEIAALVDSTTGLHKALPRFLAEAEEAITRATIAPTSKAVGNTIGDANVETETGNRIIAVRRGKQWIYGPGRKFDLRAGDTLIFRGRREGAERLRAWAEGKEAGL